MTMSDRRRNWEKESFLLCIIILIGLSKEEKKVFSHLIKNDEVKLNWTIDGKGGVDMIVEIMNSIVRRWISILIFFQLKIVLMRGQMKVYPKHRERERENWLIHGYLYYREIKSAKQRMRIRTKRVTFAVYFFPLL